MTEQIDIADLRAKLAAEQAADQKTQTSGNRIAAGWAWQEARWALEAAAVDALPALLDEIERLRGALSDITERELHHFEVEEENAALRAAIGEALHGGPNEPGGFVMTETPRRILTAALEAARQAGGEQ